MLFLLVTTEAEFSLRAREKSLNAKYKRSECGENLSIQSISKDLWGGRGGSGVGGGGGRALNPCTSDQMDKGRGLGGGGGGGGRAGT